MKPTAADHDPVFDRLVARGLEKETAASGDACPDADLLAAWFDRSLSSVEAARIEAHAASCGTCQQVLADLARSEPEVSRAAPAPQPARPLVWHWRWLVPVATAIVVVVVGTRTLRAPGSTTSTSAPSSAERVDAVAQLRAPTPSDRPAPREDVQQKAAEEPRAAIEPSTRARATEPASARKSNAERLRDQRKEAVAAPVAAPTDTARAAPADKVAAPPAAAPAGPPPSQAGGGAAARPATPPIGAISESVIVTAVPPATVARAAVTQKTAGIAGESATPLLVTASADSAERPVWWRFPEGGAIERSDDRGQTWQRQQSGVQTTLVAASAPTSRVCWIVGVRGVILRTVDGKTWQQISSPTASDLVSIRATSETTATITAADRTEYSTTDGGATWRRR